MFFGRDRFNFVFIGAGSSVFTLRLIGDILCESFIKGGTLRLVDIDAPRLQEVNAGVKRLVEHVGADFTVETHSHYSTSLKDADFVFFTYAVGSYEAWQQDIRTCTRFGVNQSVGDTIGPGAMIRILRSIPLALEIARQMEQECPHAYIINYTNPEGAQCLAVQAYTKIKTFGLCHGTPDTADALAREVFKVEPSRFTYKAAGVNHITWFTDMRIDGKDVYPELDAALVSSGYAEKEPISRDLMRVFGLYPAPGDRHVEEFFSAFLKDKVMADRDLTWKNNDFEVIGRWRAEDSRKLHRLIDDNSGFEDFLQGSGETATHFIRSLVSGEITTEMVNVRNEGYVPNISTGVVVELPAFVDAFGLHPETVGALPSAIAAKCDALGREYLLLVEAAVECDMQKLLQAVYLDPLCANCDYPEELVRALVLENLSLLPNAWKQQA